MDVQQLLAQVTDNVTVARVFGEPIQQGDTLVLPVATISGGAGGGSGTGPANEGSGSGGGGAFTAKPAGVYVIADGRVQWHPALDVTKIVLCGQAVVIVLALAARSVLRRH